MGILGGTDKHEWPASAQSILSNDPALPETSAQLLHLFFLSDFQTSYLPSKVSVDMGFTSHVLSCQPPD
jgi:hypothetical protein